MQHLPTVHTGLKFCEYCPYSSENVVQCRDSYFALLVRGSRTKSGEHRGRKSLASFLAHILSYHSHRDVSGGTTVNLQTKNQISPHTIATVQRSSTFSAIFSLGVLALGRSRINQNLATCNLYDLKRLGSCVMVGLYREKPNI